MSRPLYRQRWAWVAGMHDVRPETMAGVECADCALSTLADRGLLTTRQLADFQDATGLADLAWRIFWNRTELDRAGGDYRTLLRRAQGFAIFMHGWSDTRATWEHLPALTCAANPRLVALAPDLNGFGGSPFLAEAPAVEQCDPFAVMQSVALWVKMLNLRSGARARQRRRVITFVGHSMGGAAPFYFDKQGWHENEFARCAVAPALLIDKDVRQGFYRALGVGSWLNKPIEELKSQLTERVVKDLIGNSGKTTRTEQLRVLETTPQGTLAQTLFAMGATSRELKAKHWRNFRVILAHDDHMVNVSQMLRLLDDLGFASDQIQVIWGNHYMFSASEQSHRMHLRNREIVVGEILHLHELCREQQRL